MKENTFLTIEIQGEKNIGFINAGELRLPETTDKKLRPILVKQVEPKLIEALESHFDCDVVIRDYSIKGSPVKNHSPLSIEYKVVVRSDDSDFVTTATCNKTWLY